MGSSSLWQRFQNYFLRYNDLNFSIDISRMKFPDDFFGKMQPRIDKAFAAMHELESGALANPDEKRMVGHYWLRNPALAPNARSVSMARSSTSMLIISLAWRRGRRRRPNSCNFKIKCAKNLAPTPAKPLKRLRAPSVLIPRMCFMCCGVWRAMIRTSELPVAANRLTTNFHSRNNG
jgi:hypothetical protein